MRDIPRRREGAEGASPLACRRRRVQAGRPGLALYARLGAAEGSLSMAIAHVTTRRQFRYGTCRQSSCSSHACSSQARYRRGTKFHRALFHGTGDHVSTGADRLPACGRCGYRRCRRLDPASRRQGYTRDVPVHRHLRTIRCIGERGDVHAVRGAIADALIDSNVTAA